ncbi:MAG: hypothetical protein KF778_16935 [Rhodocyclaceae bacterium]|nr:hypothetical protein [Rhodocyclaceae bacterium]
MASDIPMSTELAQALAAAFGAGEQIPAPPPEQVPASPEQAWAIQLQIINFCGDSTGGWKVGAKSPDGPIQGCPLPSRRIRPAPTRMRRSFFARVGLELEIAFRFGRSFQPGEGEVGEAEVLAAISEMAAAIEIVGSRYTTWPQVERLAQLADLQNHGALIVGDFVPYRTDFPFLEPQLAFNFDGTRICEGPHRNPAGDPRRLLTWTVNHSLRMGVPITPATAVTTGTYIGLYNPPGTGLASGVIDGLPPLELALE